MDTDGPDKGQSISNVLLMSSFGPKYQQKFSRISALDSKKTKKIRALYTANRRNFFDSLDYIFWLDF